MVDFSLEFPAGFLWGATTAAHQVEGNNTNNWHPWEEAGRVYRHQQSGLACDWWSGRYLEDFDRAAALGHNAHRFSIEWSRIEPERARFDRAAMDHYIQMVEALHQRGLEPLITLHHFTNPLWIENEGGWTNPETIRRFERFVRTVVEELSPGVRLWCTIHEPVAYATRSSLLGQFPPGRQSLRQTYTVIENLLRAHAHAFYAIKEIVPDAQVGLAKHQLSLKPAFPAPINTWARQIAVDFYNGAVINALTTGTLSLPRHAVEVPEAADTFDWIGLNHAHRFMIRFNLFYPRRRFIQHVRPREGMLGPRHSGEIWPEGLFEQVKWLASRTDKPIYITESGLPEAEDALRPLFLVRALRSVWQAINFNYPVKGYFYRSLVDGFEWSEGYDPRFRSGLFGCDPETQERTQRPSADLYGEICAANALTADMVRRYVPNQADALFPGVDVQQEVVLPQPSPQ